MFSVTTILAMTPTMPQPNREAPTRNSVMRMLSSNSKEMVAHAATMTKERVWMSTKLSQRTIMAILSKPMTSEAQSRLVLNVYMLASSTALAETIRVPSSKLKK